MRDESPSRVHWPNVVLRIPEGLANELEAIGAFNAVSSSRIMTMACIYFLEAAVRDNLTAPVPTGYGETEEEVLRAAEADADE